MAPAPSKGAAGSSSQPPKAASEPDCTAKHADAADCSDKAIAAQWRKRAGRVLFLEVLPVCNGRRQTCERPRWAYVPNKGGATPCGPPFLLIRLSYMRGFLPDRSENTRSELAWWVVAASY